MKADMHVHTRFSSQPSEWILKKIGCPESFVEPELAYRIAKQAGMDLVTITDHNTIDGALEIAHHADVFVGEEITTFFPGTHCKAHVLAYDIDEALHADITRARENIFDLVALLRAKKVVHAVAHPLFGVNNRLTVKLFEKMLLLFDLFEINGSRDGLQNNALTTLLSLLSPRIIGELAERHRLTPYGDTPWKKGLVGGSDDHSGLNITRIHTEIDGATDKADFLARLARGAGRAGGVYSNPRAMAHNLYGIGYQFYKHKYGLDRHVNVDPFLKFLDVMLDADDSAPDDLFTRLKGRIHRSGWFNRRDEEPAELHNKLRRHGEKLVRRDAEYAGIAASGRPGMGRAESVWFSFANRTVNGVLARFADTIMDQATGADLFGALQGLGAAGALYTALSPFFVSYSLFSRDKSFCRKALRQVTGTEMDESGRFKLGHFTDTFYETNGVALTLNEQVRLARASGKEYEVLTCAEHRPEQAEGVRNFAPVGVYDLPEYPEIKVLYPPILEMLDHAYNAGFTHLHAATPGPMGLAAILVARVLKLPLSGTYHTAMPQYARDLTGDSSMEDAAWSYMAWFYNQMDKVYVPSRYMGDELAEKGIDKAKIALYPRGVDVERFTPDKRNGFFSRYGMNGSTKLLYVGRVSKEKNLSLLEEVFRDVAAEHENVELVVVGDGPYRETMERNLAGMPAVFTGYLGGDELAAAFASSDLFVFPSETDTFGNVVLQAQASGIPVVVTDKGGPCENVLHGETGLVVPGGDAALLKQAVAELATDDARRSAMGETARRYMEGRSFAQAFDRTWDMYRS